MEELSACLNLERRARTPWGYTALGPHKAKVVPRAVAAEGDVEGMEDLAVKAAAQLRKQGVIHLAGVCACVCLCY